MSSWYVKFNCKNCGKETTAMKGTARDGEQLCVKCYMEKHALWRRKADV